MTGISKTNHYNKFRGVVRMILSNIPYRIKAYSRSFRIFTDAKGKEDLVKIIKKGKKVEMVPNPDGDAYVGFASGSPGDGDWVHYRQEAIRPPSVNAKKQPVPGHYLWDKGIVVREAYAARVAVEKLVNATRIGKGCNLFVHVDNQAVIAAFRAGFSLNPDLNKEI